MSIAYLLQAAEYLDRRERESEHGYASPMPIPEDHADLVRRHRTGKPAHHKKTMAYTGMRSSHNELEKNRRAQLRTCLEQLKQIVPVGADSSRHTTLGLLMKAKSFIRNLEEKDRRQMNAKEQLRREHRHLQGRLEQLQQQTGMTIEQLALRDRTISESSNSTASTASLNSSEMDEVDILSYNDNASDTDDRSSVQSSNSDGGCAINTRKLSLADHSS
ncbi:PREDICTED: max dimerization protein 4-like [Priapulus caudatus]|uniref:Max dimerization protein 4-like n=1 Tax=Priapulus caudatus TaxID=37621 RepID=A0ABM1DZ88_PRICU|nr:PREDICTED: max dimerization protein 4-like [Priapulus caudatus]